MGGCLRLWLVLGLALAAAVRPFGRPPLPPSGRSAGQTEEADEGQESSWSGQPPPQIHEELYVPRQDLLPEPGWRPRGGPEVPPDAELDRRRRPARSAEDEEQQQSTSGQPYESDWPTTPRAAADAANVTRSSPGDGRHHDDDDEAGRHGNGSAPAGGSPGLFNPFYPLAESSYPAYAMLVLGALVLALGVVGNMAVMCIVWNNYYMRSAWNYLLASMAFWDFLVLVFCLPVVILNQLSHRRVLGDITCRMVPYMEVTSLGITSFSLCALGIDRFHAATSSSKPRPRRVDRCRSVLLKLLLVWMISLLLSSPELFLWQLSQSVSPSTGRLVDACSITPSSSLSLYLPDSLHSLLVRYQQGRLWWCLGCYFCLPVLFTLLCQLATCNVTSDSGSAQKHRAPDDCVANQTRRQHVAVERRLNRTVLALAVVYGVCVLPEHVCNVTLTYGPVRVSRETAAMLALMNHFLLFFKSSVTPVLQLCLCKALGQAFMDCCCCCCQECQPTGTQESPGSTHAKLKTANEVASSSIFFDKAKETSAVSSISS